MDEPLSNLDAQLRLQTRTELKRLHQELGTTMVYVTHDQAEAMTLGGRIAILQSWRDRPGRPAARSLSPPANTFVATFLGSPPMNLLDDPRNGRSVTLGVRPEDVQVSASARDGWEEVRVLVVEPMGSEMLVTLERRRSAHRRQGQLGPRARGRASRRGFSFRPSEHSRSTQTDSGSMNVATKEHS